MNVLFAATALAVTVVLVAGPAEAAKKRRHAAVPQVAVNQMDPLVVRDHDGEYLGRDPDPFIRLMMLKEGKIRDQVGR